MLYWLVITGSSKLPQVQKSQQTREKPVSQGALDSSRVKRCYFYKRTWLITSLLWGQKQVLVYTVWSQDRNRNSLAGLSPARELPRSGTVHRDHVPSRELTAPNLGLASFAALSISLHLETPTRCFSVFCYPFHWFKPFHYLHCWPQHYQFIFRI